MPINIPGELLYLIPTLVVQYPVTHLNLTHEDHRPAYPKSLPSPSFVRSLLSCPVCAAELETRRWHTIRHWYK